METQYYEAYNRPNVRLVDLLETPIERITESGLNTTQDTFEFDMLIYATGFDAGTYSGALKPVNVLAMNVLMKSVF